jgi:hypothetical protein
VIHLSDPWILRIFVSLLVRAGRDIRFPDALRIGVEEFAWALARVMSDIVKRE